MLILAIIDHNTQKLFIEVVEENVINENYNGNVESYIIDKYAFKDGDSFSWENLNSKISIVGDIRGLDQMLIYNSKFVDLTWRN